MTMSDLYEVAKAWNVYHSEDPVNELQRGCARRVRFFFDFYRQTLDSMVDCDTEEERKSMRDYMDGEIHEVGACIEYLCGTELGIIKKES